jgi:predicted site-specific integrase-resolvase
MATSNRNRQQGRVDLIDEGLLSPDDVALLLKVDLRTLANWRYRGFGPIFTKLGGIVRYTRSDVNEFVASSRQSITGHALAA